jgi:hypothetical protein
MLWQELHLEHFVVARCNNADAHRHLRSVELRDEELDVELGVHAGDSQQGGRVSMVRACL